MITSANITIAIIVPSFSNYHHASITIKKLEDLGFFSSKHFLVFLVENPSQTSNDYQKINEYYSLYSNFIYIKNATQLGLHGSFHRGICSAFNLNANWAVVLGDDDDILLTPESLITSLIDASNLGCSHCIYNTTKQQINIINKSVVAPYNSYIRFNSPDLHLLFGFISNVAFQLNNDLIELSGSLIDSKVSNVGHHFLLHNLYCLYNYSYVFRSHLFLVSEARDIFTFSISKKTRYTDSGDYKIVHYNSYIFMVWIHCIDVLFVLLSTNNFSMDVRIYYCLAVRKSFVNWIFQGRSCGIIPMLKIALYSFIRKFNWKVLLVLTFPNIYTILKTRVLK